MDSQASWLADGVKEIERITKAAMIVEPKVIALKEEKSGTYGVIVPGPAGSENKIEVRVAGPSWHGERLEDPKQLIAFIESMSARGVKPEEGAVYISASAIIYVFNFEDRRHRAVCPLEVSKPWQWLAVDQKPLTQREIIRVLRITFDGCLPRDSNLISLLRAIRWTQEGSADVNLQRGKEALGRQIMREVTGVADFPEEFSLQVKVFENVPQTVTVRVALELLPDVERFEVIPFPNQIHDGVAETLTWLQEDIAATKVPTFIGSVG
jgi:hypothetical protein